MLNKTDRAVVPHLGRVLVGGNRLYSGQRPVSYTHLDVYKRQVKHQLGGIDVLILTVSIVTVLWRILVADNGMDPLQSLGLGGVNGLNPGMGNG